MARFLFWNTNRKDLTEQIVRLCCDYDVDVLILAENGAEDSKIVQNLNSGVERKYFALAPQFDRITFIHRYPERCFKPCLIRPVTSSWPIPNVILKSPIGLDVLLIALHLPSKLYKNEYDQRHYACEIMSEIRFFESKIGHLRTVVVGDFNMNPFEAGLTAFDAFHSVMDRKIALKGQRSIRNNDSAFFYNPMWRLMGNSVDNPPGTYYYKSSGVVELFWHTFDQVLIRPSLVERFAEEKLTIVRKSGDDSLENKNGKPDKTRFSDHFPLFFEIDIENVYGGV
jgi:hypothetical protein